MTWLLRAGLALAAASPIAACAQTPPPSQITPQRTTGSPAVVPITTILPCDATSVDSPPGKIWWSQQRWRYASDAEAIAAYQAIVNNGQGGSPWGNWYLPTPTTPPTAGTMATAPLTILPIGTRFQMAMAPGQKDDSPGGWGTFDYIADVQDVREFLAVTRSFKAQVDRVVTYEVTRMLPVYIGPVGPQVDTQTCQYYPGRWSQFNMLPAWNQRMDYLKVIEVRAIQ